MKWGVVQTQNADGDWITHILPVVPVEGFETAFEAHTFRSRCLAANSPVLTNENDEIIATYFGHTLSKSCVCGPKPMENDSACWIHKAAN